MTSRDMLYGLQDQLVNLFGDTIYNITTDSLLYYLNKSQSQLIKNKLQLYEQTQYMTDILRTLEKEVNLPVSTVGNRRELDLPNDYNLLIKHNCNTVNATRSKNVPGVITQKDDIGQLLKDPFWTPILDEPLYYILGNKIIYEIPNNNFNITSSNITYIKKEAKISIAGVNNNVDIDSELPEYCHEEIVNIARDLIIQDKQLQVKQN